MSSSQTQPWTANSNGNDVEEAASSTSNSKNKTQEQDDAPPQMSSVWITGVAAVTSVDALDIVLDYIFAAGLVRRGGAENIGYGVWLIICTTWAAIIAIQSKRLLSGKTRRKLENEEMMNTTVLATESSLFFIEDCTLVMVMAVVDDAYDDTDIVDVLTVAISIASACITIFTYSREIWLCTKDGDFCLASVFLFGFVSSGFFCYLLIRLLVERGLSDLGLDHRITAWILYGIQMCWALAMSYRFFV